ncbi:hypothetical protein [Streptomyces xanthochromogenes]|uniref:hypothetical protein n=1 Tax=Streptomyces xanthochromogenes TaxID=67384 RepID=UPI00380604CB
MKPRNPLNPLRPRQNAARGRPARRGGLSAAALGVVALLIPPLALLSSGALRAALDFTAGVLSLVSLTASVAWGLLATDRLFLTPRDRLMAQAVHRATAVASIGFLLLHVTVKIALGHVGLLGAVVPFGLGMTGASGLIGFGSLAGILMVLTAATGAMRSAFATPGRIASRWRAVHMLAYPAWCSALVHGLYAGRPPAGWVVTMYALSLAGVAGALAVRALPRPVKRRIAARLAAFRPRTEGERAEPAVPPRPTAPPTYETYDAPPYGSPAFEPPYEAPPYESLGASSFEARPTQPLRGAQPPYELLEETRQFEPPRPLYEPPHESLPRYRPAAGQEARKDAGTGISAGYRAVSLAPSAPPPARWPAPAPRPPESLPAPAPSAPYQPPAAGEPWHPQPGSSVERP